MPTLSFADARRCVLDKVSAASPRTEMVPLAECSGRVLASPLTADRDYPPTARSVRDGFAVRASSTPGSFRVLGEVRAGGEPFSGTVGEHEAVEIMTGAPMPAGADAVLMVEHSTAVPDEHGMRTDRQLQSGENFNVQGCEAHAGERIVTPGRRINYADIALAATYGSSTLTVYGKPRVAILATGDEILDITATPQPHQIRNSNSWALAAQVERAGGIPLVLTVARDNFESTRALVAEGLAADLLLLSGGVSAGKYDIVERVLADFGAEFYFDRVAIQPGQPLVFGKAGATFFFGLPGNPSSAMITFELFARAALDRLSGVIQPALFLTYARLTSDFRHRPGLTRFLPASLEEEGRSITPLPWSGSSDVAAMARANAYLVADPDQAEYKAGDWIRVLLK